MFESCTAAAAASSMNHIKLEATNIDLDVITHLILLAKPCHPIQCTKSLSIQAKKLTIGFSLRLFVFMIIIALTHISKVYAADFDILNELLAANLKAA
ncbi:MAG: hypothetical protein Q9164_005172 [Protoblastenia rupestris]